MDFLNMLYILAGSLFCHQLPERTIMVGGELLPVCARDTGIYIGILISTVYLYMRRRFDSDKPPPLLITVILCLLMFPMLFDGITSYAGLRFTNNHIRLFTGLLFGISVPFFIIPAANFKIYGKNTKCIITCTGDLLQPIVSGLIICQLIIKDIVFPWWLISSMVFAGFLFIISRVIFTISIRLRNTGPLYQGIIITMGTLSVLLIMYGISHYILQPLKVLLLRE